MGEAPWWRLLPRGVFLLFPVARSATKELAVVHHSEGDIMLIEMSRPSERRRKKQKARERIKAKKKHADAEKRRYAESFQEFRFVPNNAPTEFVDLIRRAVKRINFTNSTQFQAWEKAF